MFRLWAGTGRNISQLSRPRAYNISQLCGAPRPWRPLMSTARERQRFLTLRSNKLFLDFSTSTKHTHVEQEPQAAHFHLGTPASASASSASSASSSPSSSASVSAFASETSSSLGSDLATCATNDVKKRKKSQQFPTFKDWAELVKLNLSVLVTITCAGGYITAGGSIYDIDLLLGVVGGTVLCAASASVFNQLVEVKYDAIMRRTHRRPLVTGAISMNLGKLVGVGSGLAGVGLLHVYATPATAALGALTIALYVCVYTPLKRVAKWNTEVGAVVGAIPPVMGWTAVWGSSGMAHYEALYLGSLLFTWQMHHFMTIAWQRRHDYANAGYWMQSRDDPDGNSTLNIGMSYAVISVALPFISYAMGFTTGWNPVLASAFNAYFLKVYWDFFQQRTNKSAKKALLAGLLQLIVLFALMAIFVKDIDKVRGYYEGVEVITFGVESCMYQSHKTIGLPKMCPVPELPKALRERWKKTQPEVD